MHPAQPSVPSSADFATEVKTDRLNIMWRVTAVAAVCLLAVNLFLDSSQTITLIAAPMILVVCCFLTSALLRVERYQLGAWTYTIGGLLSISVALWVGKKLSMRQAILLLIRYSHLPLL